MDFKRYPILRQTQKGNFSPIFREKGDKPMDFKGSKLWDNSTSCFAKIFTQVQDGLSVYKSSAICLDFFGPKPEVMTHWSFLLLTGDSTLRAEVQRGQTDARPTDSMEDFPWWPERNRLVDLSHSWMVICGHVAHPVLSVQPPILAASPTSC